MVNNACRHVVGQSMFGIWSKYKRSNPSTATSRRSKGLL